MPNPSELSNLARLLIRLLRAAGVEELVASPGSRSTPYLSAALEEGRLRVRTIVDERSAAFVALGMARASCRPVALLCTSGTAAANYLPAIVEARLTEVPLVVLTADRPMSLQHCSAPQTIDQTRIFGTHVLAATSLSVPYHGEDELVRIRRQILSTLGIALGEPCGPVHLNLHTPKPLELVGTPNDQDASPTLRAASNVEALPACSLPVFREDAIANLSSAVGAEPHGLIVCGFDPKRAALDPEVLARFARASGYPVLLDAAHPLRFDPPASLRQHLVAPFEPLLHLESWRRSQAPRIVLQIGRALTSSAFDRWLVADSEETRLRHLLLTRSGWPDPTGRAVLIGQGDVTDALARASSRLERMAPRSSAWASRWMQAARAVRDCIAQVGQSDPASPFGELQAVNTVLQKQRPGSRLVIGNSLPIREIDLLAGPPEGGFFAEALRGASGIDGVVSTASGFALADQRPNTLLVGDVSFLHDIGGLWAAATVSSPLAIVVLNNGGGRIFEQLPVASAVAPEALTHWTTPHQLDLSAAAQLYGLRYVRAESSRTLGSALEAAHARPSATILEVVVQPDSARQQKADLIAQVGDHLHRIGLLSESNQA